MGAPFVFVIGILALIAPIVGFFTDPIGTIRIFVAVISTLFGM